MTSSETPSQATEYMDGFNAAVDRHLDYTSQLLGEAELLRHTLRTARLSWGRERIRYVRTLAFLVVVIIAILIACLR